MRALVFESRAALPTPPADERMAAATGPMTQAEHDRWMRQWACMNAMELVQPHGHLSGSPGTLKVVAWNLERCKHVEASAALLAERQADIVLATEMDWGCARAGQRHTTADLAASLGHGYVFGVEFVELALGDARETAAHAGEQNLHGLHGNAVLSRFPIQQAVLIPLDDGGLWYVSDRKQGQRRIGGRHAIAAEVLTPSGVVWAVSVHFESESTPEGRAEATRRLLAGLDEVVGETSVIVGGDFNVFELSRQALSDEAMLVAPDQVEPAFGLFRNAGFHWTTVNAPGPTTRPHPWHPQDKLRLHIDWLFVRGLSGRRPWIAPALGKDGDVISDHDAIGAEFGPV